MWELVATAAVALNAGAGLQAAIGGGPSAGDCKSALEQGLLCFSEKPLGTHAGRFYHDIQSLPPAVRSKHFTPSRKPVWTAEN